MALDFDDVTTQFLSLGDPVNIGDPITVALWVNFGDLSATQPIAGNFDPGNNSGVLLRVSGTALQVFARNATDGQGGGNVSKTLSTSTWHHVALRHDGTTLSGWLDGAQGATTYSHTSGVDASSAQNFWYGNEDRGAAASNCTMAEGVIYSAALDTAELEALAAGYAPPLVRPGNIVSYVDCIRTVFDRTGNYTTSTSDVTLGFAHPRVIYPHGLQIVTAPAAAAGGGLAWKLAASRPALAGVGGLAG